MAKKRRKATTTNNRRKTTYNRKNTASRNVDLAVIGCFVIGILLTILIYAETGVMGETLSPVLGGIVGIIKYILPLGIIGIGVSLAKNDKDYLFSKICQYIVFLACIAAMMSIYQVSKGNLNIQMEFSDALERAYEIGTKNIGGGTVGTVIAYPLINLLGMFGAAVATTGIAIIMLVFTFGLKPSEFIIEILDALEVRREERNLQRAAMREERMARQQEQARLQVKEKPGRQSRLAKNKRKMVDIYNSGEEVPEIDEEQITINLNNNKQQENINQEVQEKPQKPKLEFNIFGKNVIEEPESIPQEEQMNPNELEENLFVQKAEEKEEKVKQVLQLEHNTTVSEDENYECPPVEFLKQGTSHGMKGGKKVLADTATRLQKTLHSFNVSAKVENVSVGPAITRYELKPAEGVRVSKIAKLSDDIALNLAAESIRIEAPIPGKQAVGIEMSQMHSKMLIQKFQWLLEKIFQEILLLQILQKCHIC